MHFPPAETLHRGCRRVGSALAFLFLSACFFVDSERVANIQRLYLLFQQTHFNSGPPIRAAALSVSLSSLENNDYRRVVFWMTRGHQSANGTTKLCICTHWFRTLNTVIRKILLKSIFKREMMKTINHEKKYNCILCSYRGKWLSNWALDLGSLPLEKLKQS